jgi:hypothetical protein
MHREIVGRLATTKSPAKPVIFNLVNPGLCVSNLDQQFGNHSLGIRIVHKILFRTTEVGSRTLVHAACAGPKSHGGYLTDLEVVEPESWITTDVGKKAQRKAFEQTMRILESRKPGIAADAGI